MASYSSGNIYSVITGQPIPNGTHSFTVFVPSAVSLGDVVVMNFYGNQTITTSNVSDYFTDITALNQDSVMCVRVFHGDITINSGVTFTPPFRTKGMFVFVKGNLTNNGTISMTARGANAAPPSGNFEIWTGATIPATGASGGTARTVTITTSTGVDENGIAGTNGSSRGTGGGGSGSAGVGALNSAASRTVTSGTGSAGTAWSGGSGGGSIRMTGASGTAGNASTNGGSGGSGNIFLHSAYAGSYPFFAGGGAGNTGGLGEIKSSGTGEGTTSTTYAGKDGTGGLLMIACLGTVANSGTIEAKGKEGGQGHLGSGGSSGGGSINVIHKGSTSLGGTVSVSGGVSPAGTTSSTKGGDGGAGSSNIETLSSLPRRSLIKVGSSYYYYNFESSTWSEATGASTESKFQTFGMLDGELIALNKPKFTTLQSANANFSVSSLEIQVYVPN
jgi:hypothetical protein